MFKVRKIPGCLHGVKFLYEIHQWTPRIVYNIAKVLDGEVQEIQGSGFFRLDIKEIGCLTGIYGQNQANLIVNPGKPRTVIQRKNSFEYVLLSILEKEGQR